MNRISRLEYFMKVTELTSFRSTCLSRQTGAIIVSDNRIIGTGYNGPPSGHKHCITCPRKTTGKDLDMCPAIHAETNAIMEALKTQGKHTFLNSCIYTITQPCISCLKLIINCNIKKIVYIQKYHNNNCNREKLIKLNNIEEIDINDKY